MAPGRKLLESIFPASVELWLGPDQAFLSPDRLCPLFGFGWLSLLPGLKRIRESASTNGSGPSLDGAGSDSCFSENGFEIGIERTASRGYLNSPTVFNSLQPTSYRDWLTHMRVKGMKR